MADLSKFLTATEDGSLSLLEPVLGELYHNRAGAFREALVNYAAPACSLLKGEVAVRVLDSCFGLGYNSFVFAQELSKLNNRQARIEAVEFSPDVLALLPEICAQPCFNNAPQISESGRVINFCSSQINIVAKDLRLYLQECRLQDLDFIFHDAFSPRKVPELWSIDIFAHYLKMLKDGGAVLTYSSAPAVRGALQDLGFTVMRTSGLGGKSGGTAAIKGDFGGNSLISSDFPPEEIRRLKTSSRVPYRDVNLSLPRDTIIGNRIIEQESCRPTGP